MYIFDKSEILSYSSIKIINEVNMNNILSTIQQLKKMSRENFFFMRRRIDKGNGKKTLGWVLQPSNSDITYENKDFNNLHQQKLLLENINEQSISNI